MEIKTFLSLYTENQTKCSPLLKLLQQFSTAAVHVLSLSSMPLCLSFSFHQVCQYEHTHTWFKMVCAQSSSSMSSSSKGSRTLTSFSVNRSTNPSADRETAELYVPVYIHTDLVCRSGNYSRVISVIGQFGKYVLSKAGYWSSGTIFIFYFFYLTRKIPMRLKTYFSRETFNEII